MLAATRAGSAISALADCSRKCRYVGDASSGEQWASNGIANNNPVSLSAHHMCSASQQIPQEPFSDLANAWQTSKPGSGSARWSGMAGLPEAGRTCRYQGRACHLKVRREDQNRAKSPIFADSVGNFPARPIYPQLRIIYIMLNYESFPKLPTAHG